MNTVMMLYNQFQFCSTDDKIMTGKNDGFKINT